MPITAFLGSPRAVGIVGLGASFRAGLSVPQASRQAARLFSTARHCTCRSTLFKQESRGLQHRLGNPRAFSHTAKLSTSSLPPTPQKPNSDPKEVKKETEEETELHESPYTLPNALTIARIAACPFLAWSIVKGDFALATGILVTSGLTDWLDGYLARKWNQKSVLGSVLDPMADKTLVTTLVVCLAYKDLLPLPLAVLIFSRDFGLSMWAFYMRYKWLPPPRTLKRYFDPTMPSAEVKPTQISKVNTALQLFLMGFTTVSPLLTVPYVGEFLTGLQWIVAGTTIWSGLSYVGAAGFKVLKQPLRKPKP